MSTREIDEEHGALFAQQEQLPKLPVPDLESTLQKYVESLKPVLSESEYKHSAHVVAKFGQSAQAQELQRRLKARAAEPGRASWLEEWWNDLSYMGYRDPVIPFVSYHYSYNDDPRCTRATQRAAKLISGAIAFRARVVDGSLEPDTTRTSALCSHSYNYMFNACRIPAEPSDKFRTVAYHGNETIVVVRNSRFFEFSFVRNNVVLSAAEIEQTLEQIVQTADAADAVAVGVLTTDHRDTWTRNRRMLLDAGNASVLQAIEAAAFVVCMEPDMPQTREELSHVIWHASGRNRWFDKPCQFVVTDSARAGFCGEHSMIDGTPTLRLADFAVAHSLALPDGPVPRGFNPAFNELRFQTPPTVVRAVAQAQSRFDVNVAAQHVCVLNFAAFGKDKIKKLGCSPDAFVQMVIQLASTRHHGRARPTYEASMTRSFLHGRTETCRSVSSDSVAWCTSMDDPSADTGRRIKLLRTALATHSRLTREAVNGHGVDRHLLGLRMLVAPTEPMPAIFTDPAYTYSSHWFVSTSQMSSEHLCSYGWSAVTPRGYGIAYNIRENSLIIHVACVRNEHGLNSDRFAQCLEAAAHDIASLIDVKKVSEY
ncbi:Carnitine O-acetyltransferase mitochondrial [Coemansia sp. RSA 1938]|nr:Carnitine O-acetyltransferase mitochondrial [Coemansia sp. RSA 1938]